LRNERLAARESPDELDLKLAEARSGVIRRARILARRSEVKSCGMNGKGVFSSFLGRL
jgi:hypothetical protein